MSEVDMLNSPNNIGNYVQHANVVFRTQKPYNNIRTDAKAREFCQFCGDEFILIKTLDAHLKKHHLDQVKKIWIHHCAFCLEPFPTNNQLLQHLKTTHPNAHPEYVKDNLYTCTKNAEEPKGKI